MYFMRERRIHRFILLLFITTLFFFIFTYLTYDVQYGITLPSHPDPHFERYLGDDRYKWVLLWTKFFGKPWLHFQMGDHHFSHCPVNDCVLTQHQPHINVSDAVLFHMRDMRGPRDMPHYHPSSQRWIFLMHESPVHTVVPGTWFFERQLDLREFDGMFNWTATYRRDSDFILCYDGYRRRTSVPSQHANTQMRREIIAGKERLVLWYVSNCATPSQRERFVDELSRFVPVDVFGKCGKRGDPCDRDNLTCVSQVRRRYKFYLSLENSQCRDYMSEKMWTALKDGVVPVVLGARREDYEALAPPDSFIYQRDFPTTRDLAHYLLYLDSNDTAYSKYLKWRDEYEIGVGGRCDFFCNLCAALHNQTSNSKIYHHISDWWNVKSDCWTQSDMTWFKA